MRKKVIFILIGWICLSSCSSEMGQPASEKIQQELSFSVSPLKGEETKSIYSPLTPTKMTSMYILAYRDGVLDQTVSGYFAPMSKVNPLFDVGVTYNLYFLANTSDFIPDDWQMGRYDLRYEENVAAISYEFDNYDSFENRGFPMAKSYLNWVAGESDASFVLDRLIARYTLSLNTSALNNVRINVLKANICQATTKVLPFGDGFTAKNPVDASATISLPDSDIKSLNEGKEVVFYCCENLQGELLPDNTDPWDKTVNKIDKSKATLVTYLDLTCSVTTVTSVIKEINYRVCLGRNTTTNFDVENNTDNRLVLNFVTDVIQNHDWKQESGKPDIPGKIILSKTNACVGWGTKDRIYVYCEDSREDAFIDFQIRMISGNTEDMSYTVEDGEYLGKKCKVITFTGEKPIESIACSHSRWAGRNGALNSTMVNDAIESSKNCSPVGTTVLEVRSNDSFNGEPNIAHEITVQIYDNLFPIQFRYKDRYLEVAANNPLKLGFDVRYSVKSYSGEVFFSGEKRFAGYRVCAADNDKVIQSNVLNNTTITDKGWHTVGYVGEMDVNSDLRLEIDVVPFTPSSVIGLFPEGAYMDAGMTFYMGDNAATTATYGPHLEPGTTGTTRDTYLGNWFGKNTWWTDEQADYAYWQIRTLQVWASQLTDMYGRYESTFTADDELRFDMRKNGGYNCGPMREEKNLSSSYANEYRGRPFQFVNAGMYVTERVLSRSEDPIINTEGVAVRMLYTCARPGWDLFEYPGKPQNNSFGIIWCHETQALGQYHAWSAMHGYDGGGIYLTINGCSSWAGANEGEDILDIDR